MRRRGALDVASSGVAYPGVMPGPLDDLDLLPDVTSDEVERRESSDDWLREQVPPHHG